MVKECHCTKDSSVLKKENKIIEGGLDKRKTKNKS